MMEGWKEYYLKDIVDELIMGQSPDSSSYNNEKKGIAFVQGNADMQNGFPFIRMHTTYPKRFSELGDILLSVRAPVGDIFYNNYGNLAIGRGLSAIRIKNSNIRSLVFYLLHYDKTQFERLEQGTTFTEIGKKEVRNIRIVIPQNPDEQSAIATILSKVDEAIASVQASISAAERLKKSLMQNLLTGRMKADGTLRNEDEFYVDEKFGRVPKGWEVKKGIEITSKITKGQSPKWQGFEYQNEGILFVTSENIRDGYIDVSEPKYLPLEFNNKIKNSQLAKGDVLINIVGASIGRCAIFDLDVECANTNQAVCVFRPNEENDSLFLSYYLQDDTTQKRLFRTQVETARANLSLGDFRKFKFVIPQKEEQIEVAKKIKQYNDIVINNVNKIATLERLKKSLMQNLLTGRVRVK